MSKGLSHYDLLTQLETNLRTSSPMPLSDASLRPSAVAVLLSPIDDMLHLILTKRSTAVAHHKGQVSFAGGTWEDTDPSLVHTALRELEEELGIPSHHIRILGPLPGTTTPTGFHITPFVSFLEVPCPLTPNPTEIDEVLTVPLDFFHATVNTTMAPSPQYIYQGHLIWGATARIIRQLLELL